MTIKKFARPLALIPALGLLILLSSSLALANWTQPSDNPPTCSPSEPACQPPLNQSSVNQVKSGGLGVGGNFAVSGISNFLDKLMVGNSGTPRATLEISEKQGDVVNDGSVLAIGVLDRGWDGGSLGTGARLMWISSKGAFRAGYSLSDTWNSENIGRFSIALGDRTKASGVMSTALGSLTTASGPRSLAAGLYSTASGDMSTSIGHYTIASGQRSFALGTQVTVGGDYSFGIGLDSTARTITQPNTMAIVGGNVGIGAVAPTTQLHTTGGVRFAGLTENNTNTSIITRDANGNLAWRSPGSWTGGGTGGVTSITANQGLSGGTITSTGTIGIADGGITSAKLVSNSVTTAKIADQAVSLDKLARSGISGQVLVSKGTTASPAWETLPANGDTVKQWKYFSAVGPAMNGAEVGGYIGGNTKCNNQYPGSRMMTATDFSNGLPPGGTRGWYSTFTQSYATINLAERPIDDCAGWTSSEPYTYGHWWANDRPQTLSCNSSQLILCASLQ